MQMKPTTILVNLENTTADDILGGHLPDREQIENALAERVGNFVKITIETISEDEFTKEVIAQLKK